MNKYMKKVFILLLSLACSLQISGFYHSRHRTPVFLSSRQTMWDSGARLLASGEQSEVKKTYRDLPESEKPSTQLDSDKISEIGTVISRERSETDPDSKKAINLPVVLVGTAVTKEEASQLSPVELSSASLEQAKTEAEAKIESVQPKISMQDLLAHVIKDHTRAGQSALREKRRHSMSVLPDKNREDFLNRINEDPRTSKQTKDILKTEIQRYTHHIPTDKQEFEAWKMKNSLYISETATDVSKLFMNGDYHAG